MAYRVQVNLEGVLPAGAVIGKGGKNVKWINQEAGGVRLDVQETFVVLTGRRDAVERGAKLLRAQIEANKRLGSLAYPHPLRVDYVLREEAFGSDPRLRFSYKADEAARATGRQEQLYVLSPDVGVHRGSDTDGDDLAAMLAGATLRPWSSTRAGAASDSSRKGAFHTGSTALSAAAARALSEAVHTAAQNTPRFDVLKIRLNLGKQFFYNIPALQSHRGITVAEIQGVDGGGHGKGQSVFSNCVPATAVPRVTSWLRDHLGFSLVDTKTTATLHVIDDALNVHYAVAVTLGDGSGGGGSGATLRKVKSSSTKCQFITLVSGPDQLDMRLKLLGQRRDLQDATALSVANHILRACNSRGYAAVAQSSSSSGAGSSGNFLPAGMTLDLARKKTKRVYEGEFKTAAGGRLGVKFSTTRVEDKDGVRTEVSGTVPELDRALAEVLATRGAGLSAGTTLCGPGWAAEALCALGEALGDLDAQVS